MQIISFDNYHYYLFYFIHCIHAEATPGNEHQYKRLRVRVCLRGKPRTYNKREQWVLGWRLLLANVLS